MVLTFAPLFMERVWGGRWLAEAYDKQLPEEPEAIGEAWEVVDRPEAQSVVDAGPLAGTSLHELWTTRRQELFGARATATAAERFPLLVKLLDARETLSVQVHPPPDVARELDGEPKTEMWVLADTREGAHLFAGLRAGVSEAAFREALEAEEDLSRMLHRIEVETGDGLFIPSGRVHAIGAGCLIVEIQQNSDTTYRVFDFNRPGLDGEPRELHVPESLASIDFDDVEPELLAPGPGVLSDNDCFRVERKALPETTAALAPAGECAVVAVLEGTAQAGGRAFGPGSFFLLTADVAEPVAGPATVLVAELPAA